MEKHEPRGVHLLSDKGSAWLERIETHPIWLTVKPVVKRQKMLYGKKPRISIQISCKFCKGKLLYFPLQGYQEESFVSFALHLQDSGVAVDGDNDAVHEIWMRAVNPAEIVKLEADSTGEIRSLCRKYRSSLILGSVDEALATLRSNRMIVMTNTQRHLEISFKDDYSVIRIFDIDNEFELSGLLDALPVQDLENPKFCLFVQYDATIGPIRQFHCVKFEIDRRMRQASCRILFIVHVDPRPTNMDWVFFFNDGWTYCFVDEIATTSRADNYRIPLKDLVNAPDDQPMSLFIQNMSLVGFKSLLLEMLGPNMQAVIYPSNFSVMVRFYDFFLFLTIRI